MKEEAFFPEEPFFCSQAGLYDEPAGIAVADQIFKHENTEELFDEKSLVLPLSSDGCLNSEGNDDGDTPGPVMANNKPEENSNIITCQRNPVTKNKSKRIKKICPFFLYFASQKIPIQKTRFKEKLYTEIYNWNTLDVETHLSFRELTCEVVQDFEYACQDLRVKQILKCPYIPIKDELLDGFYLYAAENRYTLKKLKQSVTQNDVTSILKVLWKSFSADLKEYYNNKAVSMNHDCNKYIDVFDPQEDGNNCDSECNSSKMEEHDSNTSGIQTVLKDNSYKIACVGTEDVTKSREFAIVENRALRDAEYDDMQDLGYESLSTSPDIHKTSQDTAMKKCYAVIKDIGIVKDFEEYFPFTWSHILKHSIDNFFPFDFDEITDVEDRKLNSDYGITDGDFPNGSFSSEVNGLVYVTELESLYSEISASEFRTLSQCQFDFNNSDLFLTQNLLSSPESNGENNDKLIYNSISYENFFNGLKNEEGNLSLLSSVYDDSYKFLLNSQEYMLTNSCSPSNLVEKESGKLNQNFVTASLDNRTKEPGINARKCRENYVYIGFEKNIYYDRVNRTIKGFSDFKLFNNALTHTSVICLPQPKIKNMNQNMTGFTIFSLEFEKILKEKNPDFASEQLKSLSNSTWMNFSELEKKEYESMASIYNNPWMSDDCKKNVPKLRSNARQHIHICLLCGKKFEKSHLLGPHAKVSHELSKAFRCVFCFEMLSSPSTLAKHCRLIHRPAHSQRYTCEICLGTFSKVCHLNHHQRLKSCTHPTMGFPWYCYEQQLEKFNVDSLSDDPLQIMSYEKECWNSVKSILDPDSAVYDIDFESSQIDDGYNSNSVEFPPTNEDDIIEESRGSDEDHFENNPDVELKSEMNHRDLNDEALHRMCFKEAGLAADPDPLVKKAFKKYLINFSENSLDGKVEPFGLGIFAHSGILELYEENEEIHREVEELHTEDVSLNDILMKENVIKDDNPIPCTIKPPRAKTKKRKKTKTSPSKDSKRRKSVPLVDEIEVTSHPSKLTEIGKMVLQGGVWKWKRNVQATEDSIVTESQKVTVENITVDPKAAATDFNPLRHDTGDQADYSEGADEDSVDILQAVISDIFEMATEDSVVTESQKVTIENITVDPLRHDTGDQAGNSEGADEDNVDILQAAISDIFEMEDFAFAADEEPS